MLLIVYMINKTIIYKLQCFSIFVTKDLLHIQCRRRILTQSHSPPKCTKYIYTVQCALVGHTAQCASILVLSSGSVLLTFVFYLYVVVVFILRVLFIIWLVLSLALLLCTFLSFFILTHFIFIIVLLDAVNINIECWPLKQVSNQYQLSAERMSVNSLMCHEWKLSMSDIEGFDFNILNIILLKTHGYCTLWILYDN